METKQTTKRTDHSHAEREQKRPAWREHLVLTERGVVRGVRGGSAFFVHFFGCSIILAAGFVLSLSLMQWAGIVVCFSLVLAAEMFNQALKAIVTAEPDDSSAEKTKALGISTAAVMVAVLGGLAAVGLIFAHRLQQVWAD